MKVLFPYGKGYVELELPPEKTTVLYSSLPKGFDPETTAKLVLESLKSPIESPPIHDLVLKARKVAILITDKTRATPNKLILEVLLPELEKAGIRRDSIEIIVATGLHAPHTKQEIEELVGKSIAEQYNVYSHNSDDEKSIICLGRTSYGTEVCVNKVVVEVDLTIGIGLIEPHFFAGYSGGRKLILPGISATKTVYHNHSYKMIAHPKADYGILEGNPVHEDMVEGAKMVKSYKFIVHVLIDKEKKVFRVVSGDPYKALIHGVKELDKYVKVEVLSLADVVIVTNGGYPLDRNLYQAVKGITTAARVVKPGGYIILLAELRDGIGEHKEFERLMKIGKPEEILNYIREHEPIRDQWEAQKFAQTLLKSKVIVVTRNISSSTLEHMNLIPATSAEEALEIACRETRCERIIAIPEGPYVVPYVKQQ